jgi:DnaJ-class molecular chaperone
MQLKVTGKGNEAPGNGISGDLIVAIEEKPHPTFNVREIICIMICISVFLKQHWELQKK